MDSRDAPHFKDGWTDTHTHILPLYFSLSLSRSLRFREYHSSICSVLTNTSNHVATQLHRTYFFLCIYLKINSLTVHVIIPRPCRNTHFLLCIHCVLSTIISFIRVIKYNLKLTSYVHYILKTRFIRHNKFVLR